LLKLGAAGKAVFVNVGFEVARVDTHGASEPDGGNPTALDELVNHGTTEVEDLSYFMEVEQTWLHARVLCVSQAGAEGKGRSRKYCETL
jgi:hypothetical protein